MDTRLLEDALVLLEEQSLSAAAARQNVTQPAFSRRIRTLENWIGRELLVRGPNRITISQSLAACEPQIRAMLAHLQELRGQMHNFEVSGEPLVFASQHTLSRSIFPEIYQLLADIHPAVVVRLRTHNQNTAMSIFLRKEADVLISYEQRGLSRMPFDDSIARHVWRRDALVPIAGGSLRYALTEKGTLPPDCRVIRYPSDNYMGQLVAAHELQGHSPLNGTTAVESGFVVGIHQLVLAGVGAAWLPHSIVHSDIVSGNVVILSADYGRIPLDIVLFVHRSNARAEKLIDRISRNLEPTQD